jgi:hypothetical protein
VEAVQFESALILRRESWGFCAAEPKYSGIIEAYHDHPPGWFSVGEWLSLVEHLVRDQGVGGSNPLSPTN